MAFLVVFLVLVALAVAGACAGADSRCTDPNDVPQQWFGAPRG